MYQNFFQPQFQPRQELIRVNGIDGARAYQMNPNSTAALFDANDDLLYVKCTDGAGFPTIRTFMFQEKVQDKPQISADYVTKKEFEEFKELIRNGKQPIPE